MLVVLAGSAIDLNWAHEHVGAIIDAWYPGEAGGTAIAEVLFGAISPAGRLPVTFPRSIADVPPITDYSMRGPNLSLPHAGATLSVWLWPVVHAVRI